MIERGPEELWTAATSARSDRYTMDERGVPSPLLMERAALCVSHEVVAQWQPGGGHEGRAVGVMVGPGNNGGDGLAVARQLHGWGVPVAAWLVTERHNAAVAEQRELAAAYGVSMYQGLPPEDEGARLWVDGLLGTGARGAPRGSVAEAVAWLERHGRCAVAIDIPTGVDPDTGSVLGSAVRARCTVTFARSKPGLHITPGRAHAGRVVVADIGLLPPPASADAITLLDPREAAAALRTLPGGLTRASGGTWGVWRKSGHGRCGPARRRGRATSGRGAGHGGQPRPGDGHGHARGAARADDRLDSR